MASEDRNWRRTAWIAARLAIFVALALTGALARDRDTRSHATLGPPDGYTARFPHEAAAVLHRGVDVYYFHDSVGHIVDASVDGDRLVVRVVIDPDSRALIEAMNPAFEVYRGRKQPNEAWIAVIPKDRNGRLMTPKEAARTWGRGA